MASVRITLRLFTLMTTSLLCSLTTRPVLSADIILTPEQTDILNKRKAHLLGWKGTYKDGHFLAAIANPLTVTATEQKKCYEFREISDAMPVGESMRRFFDKVLQPTSGSEGRADLLTRFNLALDCLRTEDPDKSNALSIFAEDITAFFHTLFPLISDTKAKAEVAKNLYATRTLFDISTRLLAYLYIVQYSETNTQQQIASKKTEYTEQKEKWKNDNDTAMATIKVDQEAFIKETAGALPSAINKQKAQDFAVQLKLLESKAKEQLGDGDIKGQFDKELAIELQKIHSVSKIIPELFNALTSPYGTGWKKVIGLSGREKISCDCFENQIKEIPSILADARSTVLEAILLTKLPENPQMTLSQAILPSDIALSRKYLALFGVLNIDVKELDDAVVNVETKQILEESRAAEAAVAAVELARTTLGESRIPQSQATASSEKKKTGSSTTSAVKRPAPAIRRKNK